MPVIGSDRVRAVVGLGTTGLSTARFLATKGIDFYVVDSRLSPPGLEEVQKICPQERIYLGDFEVLLNLGVTELYVTPGISLATPVLRTLADQGVVMRGDVDLFCDYANAPIIAITGSNAKSTVTTLVGGMLQALGKNAGIGGNLGLPALDLLADDIDYYVLELSSFQLETTHRLAAEVACILNVSEDHMDRYDSLYDYQRVKQSIYRNCQAALYNKQDILTAPLLPVGTPSCVFTAAAPDLNEFGLLPDDNGFWLSYGVERLYHSDNIALKGTHNLANVLAALGMLHLLGLTVKDERIGRYLNQVTGLKHRCELAGNIDRVDYINDSKGTNVGATIAALEGLGSDKKNIHLILGGVGKGANFAPLKPHVERFVKQVYLFGQDASLIAENLPNSVVQHSYQSLDEIIVQAHQQALAGDIVLFSPACASFDMYDNFNVRGEHFMALVSAL
ncbi:UDP-N-acetylmuramoyl-L-alanine--D-glutamate ligase [Marinomonas agarivorans]|nr:UDP-N-acetylmuramoyl-L-alanine--D-glutamate ligase [Marinomonas agarivorans]